VNKTNPSQRVPKSYPRLALPAQAQFVTFL